MGLELGPQPAVAGWRRLQSPASLAASPVPGFPKPRNERRVRLIIRTQPADAGLLRGEIPMPQGHKVRLPDGSVIHLDRSALQSWRQRRLIGDQDLVQPPGSTRWVPLGEVLGLGQAAAKPRPTTPARAAPRRRPQWGRWMGTAAATLAVSALAAAVWLTYPRWRPLLPGHRVERAAEAVEAPPPPDPLQRAITAVTQESPHLTARAVEALMTRSAAGVLDPPETFRRAYFQAGRGSASLKAAEAGEFRSLNAALYAALSGSERTRLGAYLERVRAQRPTPPQEDAEMCRLVKTAHLRLPPQKQNQLRALFEKAILAGLDKAAAR